MTFLEISIVLCLYIILSSFLDLLLKRTGLQSSLVSASIKTQHSLGSPPGKTSCFLRIHWFNKLNKLKYRNYERDIGRKHSAVMKQQKFTRPQNLLQSHPSWRLYNLAWSQRKLLIVINWALWCTYRYLSINSQNYWVTTIYFWVWTEKSVYFLGPY